MGFSAQGSLSRGQGTGILVAESSLSNLRDTAQPSVRMKTRFHTRILELQGSVWSMVNVGEQPPSLLGEHACGRSLHALFIRELMPGEAL